MPNGNGGGGEDFNQNLMDFGITDPEMLGKIHKLGEIDKVFVNGDELEIELSRGNKTKYIVRKSIVKRISPTSGEVVSETVHFELDTSPSSQRTGKTAGRKPTMNQQEDWMR